MLRGVRTPLCALLLAATLVSCGGQAPASTSPGGGPAAVGDTVAAGGATAAPDSATPVTLRILNWSQEQAEFYQEAAAEFQKEYPHITVQWDTLAQDQYRETLPLMFQSGDAPDIFFWIGRNRVLGMGELLDQGWISPVAPGDIDLGGWQGRWSAGSFIEGINVSGGKVYSFPFNDNKIWGPGYMFINRQIFRDAGLDPAAAPKTWGELRQTCATIKQQTGAYCLAVPLKGTHLQRIWYPIAGSIMSDNFFDLRQGRFAIDDPRLLKAFAFIQDLYKDDFVVPGVNDHTFARQAMATGQAAIYFDGAWMPGVFKQMGFGDLDLGVAPPPYPDDGPRGALSQGYTENKFWVSSKTKHPREAWLFLEWMTRPDGYFAKEYLARGFGTLAYTDNARYLADPAMLEMVKLSDTLRVLNPEPALVCPEIGKSKAFLAAEDFHKNWEWEAMVEALTTGADFAPIAAEIAAKKNEVFTTTLTEEQAAGLKVSRECYTFSAWDYSQPFDTAGYAQARE